MIVERHWSLEFSFVTVWRISFQIISTYPIGIKRQSRALSVKHRIMHRQPTGGRPNTQIREATTTATKHQTITIDQTFHFLQHFL
jgi:hypothetical protein